MKRSLMMMGLALLMGCGGGDLGSGCPMTNPLPPDVSGVWNVTAPTIAQSTCSSSINNTLLSLIEGPSGTCAYQVDQDGNNAGATDCYGKGWPGCVDASGLIRATQSTTDVVAGCTLLLNSVLKAAASTSTSTARYDITVVFAGDNCGVLTDCAAIVNAVWKR